MWRVCRVATLRHLRVDTGRLSNARALPTLSLSLQPNDATRYFRSIAGVDRDLLLTRSARELRDELGDSKIGNVAKALTRELDDALAREDVTSDEIIDVFTAAQKTRAISVMLKAFDFLEATFPAHINFAVYGEVFRVLARKNNPDRLIQIFETSKPRFSAVPEMIYRFGIIGYLQKNDMEAAVETWQEMLDAGHETTNEITSQLMMAYARHGQVEKVLELYESIDPQIGHWHESCIDRVILSMGIIEQPAKAFEFYSNSSMKLNGGTLMALLSVCNNNNCKQQASDILANRKKFDLRLDARGYNRIMMTLEFLERNDEIKDILEEMVESGVRFDTRTNAIIERNSQFLKETNFVANLSKSRAAGFTISPRIREMLAQGQLTEAAAYVDSIVKPVEESQVPDDFKGKVPEGALVVSANAARDVVQAYIKTGQLDKVAALVKGFSVVRGKYTFALAEVISHCLPLKMKTGDELSYAATKALLYQGIRIHRVNDALMLFRRFHDPEATLELFEQVLASYCGRDGKDARMPAEGQDENDDEYERKPHYVNFNIGKVINSVLRTLVENGRMAVALDALTMMESRGLQTTQANYVTILSSMHKCLLQSNKGHEKKKVVYDMSSFRAVLKDLMDRNLKVNKAIVGYLCPAYKGANKQQRLELLEAFDGTLADPDDTYVLPHSCYATLLTFTAQEGTMSEVKKLYDEAVNSLDKKETLGVPRSWVTVLVEKFVEEGNVEEAEQLVKQMHTMCGGYTFGAVLAVLRGAMEAQKPDVVDSMVALLEEREFIVGLSDAYELVHLARKHDLALKSLDIIQLFEKSNLKEVAPPADGSGTLEEAYFRRQRGDSHAFRKVKTMYTVALKACEKGGLWKQALGLQDQMAILLGKEVMDAIAADGTRKEKQSNNE
ncbi:unnamed protein product [Hyaloperonospora brassicae]|uniref:Pentacotripeptide-repeat region of PRORP domain-containing protein n=1 Tax=Hyaloperonospora brassicae TaxID=162125 RepID=A0AAV0T759_HYABA|nr:unnamed protein product [Hyaloperonospora brassicae]